MRVYNGNGLGDVYYQLIRDITNTGREVLVREKRCLELKEPVTLVYERPGHCWMNIVGRKFNPFFALAEVAWILTGNGEVDWIAYYNSRMKDFWDGYSPYLHGAYGLRIRHWPVQYNALTDLSYGYNPPVASLVAGRIPGDEDGLTRARLSKNGGLFLLDQVSHVVRKLKADPYSRQAVISMWCPVRDNLLVSKDYPCNNLIYYSLRDDLLEQTVVQRSNDLIWGTPYNAIQFSHLHALVAGELGVEMGKFHHVVQNMHYYFDLYKPTLAMLLEKAFDAEEELESRSIFGFCPVTDAELEDLTFNLEFIKKSYRDKDAEIPEVTSPIFLGSGYWNHVIPKMLWIYTAVKERNPVFRSRLPFVAEQVLALGDPLMHLILDFYEGSENPWAQEVVGICLQRLSVRASSSV